MILIRAIRQIRGENSFAFSKLFRALRNCLIDVKKIRGWSLPGLRKCFGESYRDRP